MNIDVLSLLLGAAVPLAGLVLTVAVSWGKFTRSLEDLLKATHELRQASESLSNRTTALEATVESHDERLDRLELPLFNRR